MRPERPIVVRPSRYETNLWHWHCFVCYKFEFFDTQYAALVEAERHVAESSYHQEATC